MKAVERLRPDAVFLAQATQHEQTDWDALAQLVAGAVVCVVGVVWVWKAVQPRGETPIIAETAAM